VSDLQVLAPPAHAGHGSAWIELIRVSPILDFVVWMGWRAWRGHQLMRTSKRGEA
jgi:hypothetical protein